MKIALISDLHGNEIALEAVMASIRQGGVDEIVSSATTTSSCSTRA